MLDLKLTLLCAELPMILLLVIFVAIWVVQVILNRRAKEEVSETPVAAETEAAQQQNYSEAPVYSSQPEEEQADEQTEVMQETAAAEDEAEEYYEEPAAEEYADEQTVEQEYEYDESGAVVGEDPEEEAEEQTEQQSEEQGEGGVTYNVTGNSVVFERGSNAKQTWAEKYEALAEEHRKMLDELFAHICGEEGVRRLDLTGNVRIKYKTHELLKVDIKRGVPVLSFMLSNTSLMRYVKEAGIKKIKITPVTVKLNDNDDLQLALRTADMALEQAKSEEEFKKQRRREQRREREQARRAEGE